MKFWKMEGLGNDFILVDGFSNKIKNPAKLAPVICDRRLGIGADGLIIMLPSTKAHIAMKIYNSDGSEPEMCGNGLRCLAKLAYEIKLVTDTNFDVDTKAGVRSVDNILDAQNKVSSVTVNMGQPQLQPSQLGTKLTGTTFIEQPITFGKWQTKASLISMGNLHFVIFVNDVANFAVNQWGPTIEKDHRFLDRTNVEFVQIIDDKTLFQRTWERGVGETQACGTGSCATAVAAISAGLIKSQDVTIKLLGGKLNINWTGQDVFMNGPANLVFSGIYQHNY